MPELPPLPVLIALVAILPLAALSGWLIAQRGIKAAKVTKRPDLSSDYFRGLNFLLNEQPDKAIEVFIQMLEVDSETVETHLALGNLFRRRGEVDRAIRIHQNIIARPTLSREQRSLALYELGQDYMTAGLLDRAENLFQELIELGEYKTEALKQLLDIYEQEKDWQNAIDIAKQYEFTSGVRTSTVISHYYCECAEQLIQKNDLRTARQMVKKALTVDKNSVRSSLLLGQLDMLAGDCKSAIRAYKKVEKQDAEYLPEIIEPLESCFRSAGELDEFKTYLNELLQRYGGVTVMLSLASVFKQEQGEREATNFIIDELRKRPSVRGLERLVAYNMQGTEGAAKDNLYILNELIKKLLKIKALYKCRSCGFEGKTLHWHCPSCKRWNTVKPIQDIVET